MGLDITFYDQNNKVIKRMEFNERLHYSIFVNSNNWSSYMHLTQLRDYYRTDVTFGSNEIAELIDELKQIKIFIDKSNIEGVDGLIYELNSYNINKIHFGGD